MFKKIIWLMIAVLLCNFAYAVTISAITYDVDAKDNGDLSDNTILRFGYSNGAGAEFRASIDFDVSSIPADIVSVDDVIFNFYLDNLQGAAQGDSEIYVIEQTTIANTGTGAQKYARWNTGTKYRDDLRAVWNPDGETKNFDLGSNADDRMLAVVGDSQVFTLAIYTKADGGATSTNSIRSSDYGSNEPTLTVEYTEGGDSIPPNFTNFVNNASTNSFINGVVNWSINMSDETELRGYIFAHNQTGILTNGSFKNLNGMTETRNETLTITLSGGNYICGQFWFNDTEGNFNQTSLDDNGACFIVANLPPLILLEEMQNRIRRFILFNEVKLPYSAGEWNWTITVIEYDLLTVNYTFYNSSKQIQSNQSDSLLDLETPDSLFAKYTNASLNLTVWAKDIFNNITQTSILFNVTAPPVITVVYPNQTYNETYNINVSINITTDIPSNCTLNNSIWLEVVPPPSALFHRFREKTLAPNQFYHITVRCNNSEGAYSVNNIFFTKDTEIPSINSVFPAEDNSTKLENKGSIIINFTATDNNDLYFYNISIWELSTLTLKFNQSSSSLSGTSYSYSKTLDTSNWGNITYLERIEVCDSHTEDKIPDINIIETKDMIIYQYKGTVIKIKSFNGNEKSTKAVKKENKYTSQFYYDSPTLTKVYELSSNQKITYLPDSEYTAHFITNKLWVDFENPDDVSVEFIDEKTYNIYVANNKDFALFSSVGFLNCITEDYQFELTPEPLLYDINLLTGNLFNTNILDTSTTAGVLLFFFLFFMLVAVIIFGEISKIPIIMLMGGIFGFFFGLLIYVSISAIIGIILVTLSIMYILRSIFAAK